MTTRNEPKKVTPLELPIAVLVLLSLVWLLGAMTLRNKLLATYLQPRLGGAWVLLVFPIMQIVIGVLRRSRSELRIAGITSIGLAIGNAYLLLNSGTVGVVRKYYIDQLHSAWLWQVAALVIIGSGLILHTYKIAAIENQNPTNQLNASVELTRQWHQFGAAPWFLKAFLVFGACAIAIECVGMFSVIQRSHGSAVIGVFTYVIPCFMVYKSIPQRTLSRLLISRAASFLVFFGIVQIVVNVCTREVSREIAVARILMPTFWAAMCFSPTSLNWMRGGCQDFNHNSQTSIIDLVYLTGVAAGTTTLGMVLWQFL